ncbi:MAG: substrate-binding domain-containing protein [Planctomycetes bacterium]|nr:substrate-binding domain-containing protein [Planctomycetota bacterium]
MPPTENHSDGSLWWEDLEKRRMQGVFVLGPMDQKRLGQLSSLCPVVHLDPQSDISEVSSVRIDNVRGGALAAEHLLAHGHRKMAVLLGDQPCATERLNGFKAACAQTPDAHIVELAGDFSSQSGSAAAGLLLGSHKDRTALFCCNDEMAAGVIQVLTKEGKRVPEDISIMGFDNSAIAELVAPPLSSVGVSTESIAQAAVYNLFQQIESNTPYVAHSSIIPFLVERVSVSTLA